ncbi:MAG: ShlB/FhaC/HecB family hemolysin secretion/activation protein [Synechococcales cyanobacterium CRU_2_2]|nr:ShlB/FhaC/HecB family hemolysin secretion/activation protein [Synechococcales cyanobacterium CRU_2_2]
MEREEPETPAELLAQLPRSLTPAPLKATPLSPVAQTEPGRTIPTPRPDFSPPEQPLPTEPLPQLPPVEELLPSPSAPNIPGDLSGEADTKIEVTGYRIEGSTVFDEAELAAVTAPYVGSITFAQLLQARSAVTQLYVNQGYATSGAFIPPQTLTDGKVTIQVLEGTLEEIKVVGTNHLKPFYVRDRLALAGAKPLNVNQLLEGLKLLQLDPLLRSVSADLQAGIQPGTSALEVTVAEADPFATRLAIDNERSPSVGTFRRKIQFDHRNLIGIGDSLGLAYSNTDGSNGLDVFYAVPFNATNGTVRFSYGRARSNVVEKPFSNLDISSKSTYYELNIRQPVERTPTRDIALGLAFSRQESQSRLGFADIGPFPLSPGASERGETRVSVLRFFQEWSDRNSKQVLAARSQFSLGVPWFEATDNTAVSDEVPDSEFFAWRTQAQWVRLLAPDALLLIRGDVQLSDRALLPLEQFGVGGAGNGRGYRQDTILSDSGFQITSEVRLPLARFPKRKGLVQVIPFLDWGRGWNNTFPQPDTKTLLSTGLGLLWQQGNHFSARLDWGYPLINRPENRDNWQENGLYFSVEYTPF